LKTPDGFPPHHKAKNPSVNNTNPELSADHIAVEFQLRGEHIALCDLLKLTGIADSGGQGKQMVAEGMVKVDGQVELRKTAKIRAGQVVACGDQRIRILPSASPQ
jgi:ribosome-associated protein